VSGIWTAFNQSHHQTHFFVCLFTTVINSRNFSFFTRTSISLLIGLLLLIVFLRVIFITTRAKQLLRFEGISLRLQCLRKLVIKKTSSLLYERSYPRVAELIQDPLSCLILSESSSITYVFYFFCCVNMHQLAGLAACWRTTLQRCSPPPGVS